MPTAKLARTATMLMGALALSSPAVAETADRFLEALQRRDPELAIGYLDRAPDNPLVSEEFKAKAPLLKLRARAEAAVRLNRAEERAEELAALSDQLRRFESGATDSVTDSLRVDVLGQIATASAESARRQALTAMRAQEGNQREALLESARRELDLAERRLELAAAEYQAELLRLKNKASDQASSERRLEATGRQAVMRLLAARLVHERAMTHPTDSPERNRLNKKAAERLGELYTQYSRLGVGLMAHLYEGRCYRQLGEFALARAALEDLATQPAPTTELRQIVTLAYAELSALLLEQGKSDAAIERPTEWLEGLPPSERVGAESATLRFRLGEALEASAEKTEGAEARRLLLEAREQFAESAREPNEQQAAAREAWARLNDQLGIEPDSPRSFDEALSAGKETIAALNTRRAAPGADPASLGRGLKGAVNTLEEALGLADDQTPLSELNEARYLLCYLYWDMGADRRAAVIAEYLARRHATDPSAPKAARLAMAACERLIASGAPDADALGDRLRGIALATTKQWPGEPVGDIAYGVLLGDALRTGRVEEARRLIESVDEAARPGLALRFALARYERSRGAQPGERAALLAELDGAYRAVAEGPAAGAVATASLYLAQAAIERGEGRRAKALLLNERHGPYTLAKDQTPPANTPAFRLEAFKTKLRADALAGESTEEAMRRLGVLLESAPEEQTGGDRAWLALAAQLQEDMSRAASRGGAAERRLARLLEGVLDRLKPLAEGGGWNTRLWLAQARLRVGESLGPGEASRENLRRGREAFADLIERAESESGFAPSPTATLAARLKLAECDRALGRYEEAMDQFGDLLEQRSALLDVQRAAAQTLHDWAESSGDAKKYEQAIVGARPGASGKNIVWGWSKLAAIAARAARSDPARRDLFFEAWLGVARARRGAALASDGTLRRQQLTKAAGTIRAMERQHPDLGGEARRAEFQRLLESIENELDPPEDAT